MCEEQLESDQEFDFFMTTKTRGARNEPSSGRPPSSITSPGNVQQKREESVYYAIEQVHAIMDIYTLTKSVSPDIITTTLDGVIQKVFREKTHVTETTTTTTTSNTTGGADHDDNRILYELEGLVGRLGELNIPLDSIMSLKAMLSMQRTKYESQSPGSKWAYVDRAAKLLLLYYQGGACQGSDSNKSTFQGPREDTREVLRFAKSNQVGMTPHLWDLFEHLRNTDPEDIFVKEITNDIVRILSSSDQTWKEQCLSLHGKADKKAVCETSSSSINTTMLQCAEEEHLEHAAAFSKAAALGRAQEATRLFRSLYKEATSPDQQKELWCQLLMAYANSNHNGSVAYMERLLLTQNETRYIETFNICFQSMSKLKTPGKGLRAEMLLNQMLRLDQTVNNNNSPAAGLTPDMESLNYCVTAFLDEKPRVLYDVVNADNLARWLCLTYNATKYDLDSSKDNKDLGVFEKLLKAYAFHAFLQQDVSAVIKAAEQLFRFFLLQHRAGRVTEHPSYQHLVYMLQILNQKPHKSHVTSLEFFRLFEAFGIAESQAAARNEALAIVVDTLTQSGQTDLASTLKKEL